MYDEYMTVKDFCHKYESIMPINALRGMLANPEKNDVDYFIRRIGRKKLVVNTKKFFEWLDSRERTLYPYKRSKST